MYNVCPTLVATEEEAPANMRASVVLTAKGWVATMDNVAGWPTNVASGDNARRHSAGE